MTSSESRTIISLQGSEIKTNRQDYFVLRYLVNIL
uniref:Uncharacterized protein n=1 Tax=Siphoviridae sp. ctqBH20 TaxID=2825680 RepID=A0A8S5QBQ3_9CAUD|nr:MAG TPA: hypothetical protein [Siphoviridae sp. ctqBH20]